MHFRTFILLVNLYQLHPITLNRNESNPDLRESLVKMGYINTPFG
jgi:hypothetical protein